MPAVNNYYIPPIFPQADQRIQGSELRNNRALEEALAQRRFSTRTIPDFINSQAARGAFHTGATSRGVSRAAEDFATGESAAHWETAGGLADILRNQFLIGLGVRL